MHESNLLQLLQLLGQVSAGDTAEIFRDHLRGCVREMICEVMAAEVIELCGPKHSPIGGEVFRSGSFPGRVICKRRLNTAALSRFDFSGRNVQRS